MDLPVVRLSGTAHQQGIEHGRVLKDRIAHNLELYFKRFEDEGGLPRAKVLERASAIGRAMEDQCPGYCRTMIGVAEGAGFDIIEITALNARYEILYDLYAAGASQDGCTAFAILPERIGDGHALLGQNWDWIPDVAGAVLHVQEEGSPERLCFTEAGIVGGKIGLNACGIGLAINGLHSTADDWSRLCRPFHVRCRDVLRAEDINTAMAAVTDGGRSCSANFLIADAEGRAVDIETAPNSVRVIHPENGCLSHTNHFLDPSALGVTEPVVDRPLSSEDRLSRIRELLGVGTVISRDELEGDLRDHEGRPYSICRHVDPEGDAAEQMRTVTSIVMDLTELTFAYTNGPPCRAAIEELRLAAVGR